MKKIKSNILINNQIKAHEENKINNSSDFPSACEIEKNSLYYLSAFDIIDNDPTKTNTGRKFANPGYITWDFEQKTWLNVGIEPEPTNSFEKKNGHLYWDTAVKKRQKNHSTRILLPLAVFAFIFVLLYSCSHGDFTKKSQLKTMICGDKQDISNSAYALKINKEQLKSDEAKLQALIKKQKLKRRK